MVAGNHRYDSVIPVGIFRLSWVAAAVALTAAILLAWIFWPGGRGPATSGEAKTDDGAGGVTFSGRLDVQNSTRGVLQFVVDLNTHSVEHVGRNE